MSVARGAASLFRRYGAGVGRSILGAGKAGYEGIKQFVKHPIKGTIKSFDPKMMKELTLNAIKHPLSTAAKEWKATSLGGKALFGGLVVAPQAIDLAATPEPGGPGRAEKAGRLLGSMAGGLYFSRAPFLGSMVGWTASEAAGGISGKVFGKATGIGKAKPITEMSLTEKLHKTAEKKKIRRFARERIREVVDKPSQLGDIATATWRDPTGTFERQA